ncbi:site-specific integrase, partial [Paenibacillus sp. TAF58]
MEKKLLDYRFTVKETEYKEIINGDIKKKHSVSIGLLDIKRNLVIPHPLTDFIRLKYEFKSKSISTQLAAARTITRFLNFIYTEIINENEDYANLISQGIHGLKLFHGSMYITSLSANGIKKSTVENYEVYLKEFYLFLQELKLVDLELNLAKYQDVEGKWYEESPFS